MILFDQLDRLPGDWGEIQKLTKGLLQIALTMKSYQAIRLKVFMRSDQETDDKLFDFPDASKVRGEQARLGWQARNLFGLLYYTLWNDAEARKELCAHARHVRLNDLLLSPEYGIPVALATNDHFQGKIFDRIAGTMMGGGSRRGRPYTWIPTHLADGRLEISPRSFLTAIRVAAEEPSRTGAGLAFDYYGIQSGVKAASQHRVDELQQDYPWIKDALAPLRGLVVPVDRAQIRKGWEEDGTYNRILNGYTKTKAPIELVLAREKPAKDQASALTSALVDVGVFENREGGRVNIPDIFRIDAGIGRRGGITPQQRRRI